MNNQYPFEPFRCIGDIKSVEELLRAYPGLIFNPRDEESWALWKDLIKTATPKNHKKDLTFDNVVMSQLLADELSKLVILRNILLNSMRELGSRCTKVTLLKSVSEKTGNTRAYSLGGGRRPDTKRLILIYEAEADVTAKKRKSCQRRIYRPRKRSHPGMSDLIEECFRVHPLMHGDSFQNLFDEDQDHGRPMDATSSSSGTTTSSSTNGSFYSSNDEMQHSLDEFMDGSTSDDDFEVIDVEEFNT